MATIWSPSSSLPARVDGEHAVSVAVERHTEIEPAAPHGLREQA